MKILVTGYKGQLGYDVVNEARSRGIEAVGVDVDEMDITDSKQVDTIIKLGDYDAIVHCAAWTAVDKAEEMPDACYRVNVEGTQNIANVCKELNIPLMYFSTDYVFNGEGERPWQEYDERHPLNIYGDSKYKGELAVESLEKHFIIRIAWVFGVNGKNFVKTMLRLGKENGEVKVVNDQIGSPTYTYDLAKLVVDMIQTNKYGIYHATNEGLCSWYEFACEIFKQANMNVDVIPVDSKHYITKAKRPSNSRMSKTELDAKGFNRLPTWQDALQRYLKIILGE